MAQGDPPVYQLVDSNGNVQAEIRHDLAQSLIIDQLNGSDIDFQQSDLSNIASVSTDKLNNTQNTQSVSNNQIDYVGSFIDVSAGDGTNLQTINNTVLGSRVVLTKTSGNDVTIENGTGNIFLSSGQDGTLAGGNALELFCVDGENWSEIGSRIS